MQDIVADTFIGTKLYTGSDVFALLFALNSLKEDV